MNPITPTMIRIILNVSMLIPPEMVSTAMAANMKRQTMANTIRLMKNPMMAMTPKVTIAHLNEHPQQQVPPPAAFSAVPADPPSIISMLVTSAVLSI